MKLKLTLKQKREIVIRFLSGDSVEWTAFSVRPGYPATRQDDRIPKVEQVLRDYMLNKFKLEKSK